MPTDVGDADWDGNTSELLPKDLGGADRKDPNTVHMGRLRRPVAGEEW